ncbi:LysR family transcriptional regulator [Photobacterium carnosum]|uniref:LysR family transcriptional regulator n=1 Tax=Photobacterium carnosum TaxID=2023717 RepID=A0A2N4URE1_9GAMM|nr:LysR family transcriptional regulator [Photobacterium carnosum]KAE8177155.1 LysR family transcriptional regulator [Photobacterium carnosum]MCD9495098.1 LysR family transcriptional regulator [Photobacterium carnosum]MCD9515005.1 LysR family transcriptional regulator [Photobacterium carnosum]MCD9522332.1 LysR family transcriptional regulator [Photobacterium carnosum]MCD9525611.1 LysR family transcriptional regulator [Photobacterium carnosum]
MTNNKLFDGIVVFVQVIKSGGFGAAAEVLGHSNSYISKEINKLESRLGVRLLNRTTRSVALTPEGDVYYQECLQLVMDAEQALGLMSQNSLNPKGLLKISCPVWLGSQYLQQVFSEYLTLYPDMQLDIDLSDKTVDVVADGYDLVIRASATLAESSLICKRLFSCNIHTVASPEYLRQHGFPKHPSELQHHYCLCYSNLKHADRWQYTDAENKVFNVDVQQKLRCNNTPMTVAMAVDGMGICHVPTFYIESQLQRGELTILFPEFDKTLVNVYVVYPSRKHLSAKVRRFIDLLERRMSK